MRRWENIPLNEARADLINNALAAARTLVSHVQDKSQPWDSESNQTLREMGDTIAVNEGALWHLFVCIQALDERPATGRDSQTYCTGCNQPPAKCTCPLPPPRIVSAAVRLSNGLIVCGPRHFDKRMRTQIEAAKADVRGAEQGFVDQFGTFYDRKAAYQIAAAQMQIRRPMAYTENLYSENLY